MFEFQKGEMNCTEIQQITPFTKGQALMMIIVYIYYTKRYYYEQKLLSCCAKMLMYVFQNALNAVKNVAKAINLDPFYLKKIEFFSPLLNSFLQTWSIAVAIYALTVVTLRA